MISINEVQDEVIAEFNDFDDWMDRYQLLIDLGKRAGTARRKYKTEQNLIEGCQSRMAAGRRSGRKNYFPGRKRRTDCRKGIISLLIKVLRAHTG